MTAVATVQALCACGCGQAVGMRRGKPNKFIGRHNASMSGVRHANWRGGKPVEIQGYQYVGIGSGKRRRVHLLIAERAMGRPMPRKAQVHHVNGSRSDNRNANLVVCENAAYHRLLHVRQKALDATGNANLLRCRHCTEYDTPENLTILSKGRSAGLAQHRACHATREAARNQSRAAS